MKLLETQEAAKMLGISWRTLSSWRLKNRGPAYFKFGDRVVYSENDVKDFRNRCRVEPKGIKTIESI